LATSLRVLGRLARSHARRCAEVVPTLVEVEVAVPHLTPAVR